MHFVPHLKIFDLAWRTSDRRGKTIIIASLLFAVERKLHHFCIEYSMRNINMNPNKQKALQTWLRDSLKICILL